MEYIALAAFIITIFKIIQTLFEYFYEYIFYFFCFVVIFILIVKVVEYFTCDRKELIKYKNKKQEENVKAYAVVFSVLCAVIIGCVVESFIIAALLFAVLVIVLIPLGKYASRIDEKKRSAVDVKNIPKKNKIKKLTSKSELIELFDNMNDLEFKNYLIHNIFPYFQYKDINELSDNSEYGLILSAKMNSKKYLVMCANTKVTEKLVEEVINLRKKHKLKSASIFTSHYLSSNAVRIAEEDNIQITNVEDIYQIVTKVEKIKYDIASTSDQLALLESYVDGPDINSLEKLDEESNVLLNAAIALASRDKESTIEDDMFYLEDYQKELVTEEKYDVFNFEEESLEDDDYHIEDV